MRASGILLHISSLPGEYGIGKLGKEAYAFADFLKKAGQKYWQVLPVSPTSYGDSPYQSFSVFAGNPYFIDFETLEKEGLLRPKDYKDVDWGSREGVDYGHIYKVIFPVLKKAYKAYVKSGDGELSAFIGENPWVKDYGLFMALKFAHKGKAWYDWEEPLRMREPEAVAKAAEKYADEVGFHAFLQYEYSKQWKALKAYVNGLGIDIIGDMPIYVAYDSVEVWTQPELFLLDEERTPIDVAGCPPDAFTSKGQLWGNPLYRWDFHEETGFAWWTERLRAACTAFDVVRIDHFRGFESYYCIPYGNEDAVIGEWRKGPGMKLFNAMKAALGKQRIIAEDLGFITKDVKKLLKASGYPGMKVLQFAFDSDPQNPYLPHNYESSNCVCYTGTHDNETALGWVNTNKRKTLKYCREYLNIKKNREIPWAMIRAAWGSVADTAVAPMQDFLALDSSARMTIPSTLGGNWEWRMKGGELTDALAERIYALTCTYGRIVPEKPEKAKAAKKEKKAK